VNSVAENLSFYKSKMGSRAELVAVSKFQSMELILEAYNAGHRHFGENYVQELSSKADLLPKDIVWHFIGHLQTNKVKVIAPFVGLIHSVDSLKLLLEIDKQAAKNERKIDVLIQVHISNEESKEGIEVSELAEIISFTKTLKNINLKGFMGMASYSSDSSLVESEFKTLKNLFDIYFDKDEKAILSMGMSGDFELALNCGSTMLRIGTAIFGNRKT
jgi:PLP dependent protein